MGKAMLSRFLIQFSADGWGCVPSLDKENVYSLKVSDKGEYVVYVNMISNIYADDITLMAESEEELKSLLMRVKEESEKTDLKLSIQKTKIMCFFFHSWKPTCDVFHKHEDYMQEQFTIYQETIEKDNFNKTLFVKILIGKCIQNFLKVNLVFFSLTGWGVDLDYYIEEDNRMGKTRDLFKKIRATNEEELKSLLMKMKQESEKMGKQGNSVRLFLGAPKSLQMVIAVMKLKDSYSLEGKREEKGTAENEMVLNDSAVNNHPKCTHVTAFKNSQNVMQFRLVTPQKQSNRNQWLEKRDTDAECGDKETIRRQLPESKCASQVTYAEHFGKPIESNSDEVEERAGIFPRTPEIPLFLRTPEDVKTPDSVEKLPKTPSFEINRDTATESQTQKDSPGFSFLMSYTSRSPGLNLFDSSVFDSEISSHQFSERYSSGNLNPLSSQQEIGNLFGKPEREDAFTFSFPSDSSTHTFGAGRDDFSFPFSFEQDQNSALSSEKGFSSSSQNTTQFTFF
ncbi:hypothetical protein FD754_021745 [Muntiacus muntjak]|uniref:Uncharacterized protein n=1 Tax=Muntiacus muntjak TaxID=9888 RepID=A0A5N3V6Y9_MUNMU|nr:hypothetical protein FD754_021745 [Muntiacus muntjak]